MRDMMVDTQRLKAEAGLLRKRAATFSDQLPTSALNHAADLLDEIAMDIERAASLSYQPSPSLRSTANWLKRLSAAACGWCRSRH
jgi:hypothetical protein